MDNLNPIWPSVTLSVQSLCNGDYDRALRIEVSPVAEGDGDLGIVSLVTPALDRYYESSS